MKHAFWKSTSVLLRYRAQLVVAFTGAAVNAMCFGAGLGMILPALYLLTEMHKGLTLADILLRIVGDGEHSAYLVKVVEFVAGYLPTDPFLALALIFAAVFVLAIIGNIGRFTHEMLTLTVVMRASMLWRLRMFRRLIHAPLDLTMRTGNADHINRTLGDTEIMVNGYRAILGKTLAEVLKSIAAVAMALFINWQMTLLAMVGVPLILWILRYFGKRVRRFTKRMLQRRGELLGSMYEAMEGIMVVKAHNAEGQERRRFKNISRIVFNEEMRMRTVRSLTSPVIDVLTMLGVMVVGMVAGYAIFRKGVPAQELITVLGVLAGAAGSVKPLSSLNNTLNESYAAADRVMEVLALPVEPTGVHATQAHPPLPRHRREVAFENITFTYPSKQTPALNDVSLRAAHGMVVAIVGGNGSGKSTLLSMLPRLLTPASGRVAVDGVDIATASLRSLRKQISIVTQQSVLFQGTVADNIAYGRRHEPRERIIAAARTAHADDFIRQLPQGYDTPLGAGGMGLSGGQRQRLCIARAVLRDPAILILDEATSQIDADSEAKINQALEEIRGGRTIFIIAHRLSTVVNADVIAVMADGRIVDQGKHHDLLDRCNEYRILTQTQLMPPRTSDSAT